MTKVNSIDIEKIILMTFPDVKINCPIDDLKIGDLEAWDSLGNFNLLLAAEEFYNIRFSMEQMSEIKSIKQLVEAIERQED